MLHPHSEPNSRRVLLFFVDGMGVGPDDPDANLLATGEYPSLGLTEGRTPMAGVGSPVLAGGLDASMGVPGLPQSATGQTALLTGINAPEVMGAHISGFPGPALRRILLRRSILKQVRDRGRSVTFLNAYRPAFFDTPERKRRLSATSLATMASGTPFRSWRDVLEGRAVVHDLTHWRMRERGYDLPDRSPEEAGGIIARETMRNDFSLFEYFETDRAGHDRDRARLARCLRDLDRALESVLRNVDLAATTVLVVSDHGNAEDLGVKTHTLHPAFFAAWGAGMASDLAPPRALTDVVPLVLRALGEEESGPPAGETAPSPPTP
jgi:hypothetical protein